jgi:hypothetical protein
MKCLLKIPKETLEANKGMQKEQHSNRKLFIHMLSDFRYKHCGNLLMDELYSLFLFEPILTPTKSGNKEHGRKKDQIDKQRKDRRKEIKFCD